MVIQTAARNQLQRFTRYARLVVPAIYHQRTIDEVSKYQRWRQTGVLGDLQDKLREYLLTVWAACGIEMA